MKDKQTAINKLRKLLDSDSTMKYELCREALQPFLTKDELVSIGMHFSHHEPSRTIEWNESNVVNKHDEYKSKREQSTNPFFALQYSRAVMFILWVLQDSNDYVILDI